MHTADCIIKMGVNKKKKKDDFSEENEINKSDSSCWVAFCNPSLQLPLLYANHLLPNSNTEFPAGNIKIHRTFLDYVHWITIIDNVKSSSFL
jgi:hypothetical protein